jgi:hypothetical protein
MTNTGTFVFLDAHEESIDDGLWNTNPKALAAPRRASASARLAPAGWTIFRRFATTKVPVSLSQTATSNTTNGFGHTENGNLTLPALRQRTSWINRI